MRAFHHQQIILGGNFQLAFSKARNGNRNAVVVFVYQLNVVRRVAAIALALIVFQQVKQTVKTNSRTVQRG